MNYLMLSNVLSGRIYLLDGTSFFSQIVDILFSGATELVQTLAALVRTVANSLIYADGTGTSPEFSTIFIIILTLAGIAIVFGLVMGTFQFIKYCLSRVGR